jgi:beta-lactamase regulating signal transducer with metallopeptidase domain
MLYVLFDVPLLAVAIKGSLVLVLVWLINKIFPRLSAAQRAWLWFLGLSSFTLLPLLELVVPNYRWAILSPATAPPRLTQSSGFSDDYSLGFLGTMPASYESFIFLGVWLTGALICLIPLLRGMMGLSQIARHHSHPIEDSLAAHVNEWAASLGLKKKISLCFGHVGSTRGIPLVWGLLAPRLLLPLQAAGWSEKRLAAVLLHELAHIRRGDCITLPLAHVFCAFFWFDPLVWLALRRLRSECECASDDQVIATGFSHADYAQHLLEIHRDLLSTADHPGASSIMPSAMSLLHLRISTLLDGRRNRLDVSHFFLIVTASLLVLFLIILALIHPVPQMAP